LEPDEPPMPDIENDLALEPDGSPLPEAESDFLLEPDGPPPEAESDFLLEPDESPPEAEGDFLLESDGPLPEAESEADGNEGVLHEFPTEEGGHWREAREATLRKIAPVVATSKTPVELRILRRYLLAGLGLLSVGLLLTIMDEGWHIAHLTAATTVLMLGVVGISLAAIFRSRTIVEGLIRTTTPSVRDALTGLPDEQYFRLRLREECKRVSRYGIPVSLAIIDVNNLASVNEAYGEACGDAVLSHIASILESTKRASDIAARLSDDEFALILLECARPDAYRYVARLEQYVARRPATVSVEGQPITLWIGVCIGLASAVEEDMSQEELLAQARQDLDAAKGERDRRRERWTSGPA
jgi:diguanylate cyclase (GGDEF)-like protein